MRCLGVALLLCAYLAPGTSPALAEPQPLRPTRDRVLVHIDPGSVPAVVNSKLIFLNRCVGGCKVYGGYTDARANKSGIGQGTLSAFAHGNTTWTAVVSCMKSMFSRFNVTVTDVDPGPMVDHFEVMIAGTPGQIGVSNGVGGIAEYSCTSPGVCSKYMPNALVFAFAGVYPNNANEICATAAQELAHTWTLDHVTDASDPMTYFSFSGMRQFKDGVTCGSDCVNGKSPFGLTCSGSSHICMSTGIATQNDVQILSALFGPAGAVAPTLKVTNPTSGSTQQAGFAISVECTSGDGVQEVNLSVDGVPKASLLVPPFNFMAPATLTDGPHKVSVLCASRKQAISIATADVIVGSPCSSVAECPANHLCFNGACLGGPGAPGGLGATCTGNADCKAGECASDGEVMACTIPCTVDLNNCPDGFGCLEAGTSGVCWYGVEGEGGCCDTGGGGAGSMLLGLGIAALWITRRRSFRR